MSISLSNPNWQDDKCTSSQRQYIDLKLRCSLWLDYSELISICNEMFKTSIRDIGQLTKGQASQLIRSLESKITNRAIR